MGMHIVRGSPPAAWQERAVAVLALGLEVSNSTALLWIERGLNPLRFTLLR